MSHWGAFAADVDASGEVTAVRPDALDPAPSPLLGNFVGALRHPLRVADADGAPRVAGARAGPGRRAAAPTSSSRSAGTRCSTGSPPSSAGSTADHGAEAVFGGSYGWSSAGRFHHAQSQLHRFLELPRRLRPRR